MVQFLQKGLQRHLDDVSKLYVIGIGWQGRAGLMRLVLLGLFPVVSDLGSEYPGIGDACSTLCWENQVHLPLTVG